MATSPPETIDYAVLDADKQTGWRNFLTKMPPGPGLLDLYCMATSAYCEQYPYLIAALVLGRLDDDSFLFDSVVVVDIETATQIDHVSAIEKAVGDFAPDKTQEAIEETVRRRLQVRLPVDREASSLLALLSELPATTAVVVLHAELYKARDATQSGPLLTLPNPLGNETDMRVDDGIWGPHMCSLADKVAALDRAERPYVVFMVNYDLAVSEKVTNALEERFDALLWFTQGENALDARRQASVATWQAALLSKDADAVRSEIVAEMKSEVVADQILSICLAAHGRYEEAYRALSPHLEHLVERAGPGQLVELARVAALSGRIQEAKRLLKKSTENDVIDEAALEGGHRLSRELGDNTLQRVYWSHLEQAYPNSPYVIRHSATCRLLSRDWSGALQLIKSLSPAAPHSDGDIYLEARAEYGLSTCPDRLQQLIFKVEEKSPKLIGLVYSNLIEDALTERRPLDALDLVVRCPLGSKYLGNCIDGACKALAVVLLEDELVGTLNSMDEASLSGAELFGSSTDTATTVVRGTRFILRYVSNHPEDLDARTQLIEALGPGQSGFRGVLTVLDLADKVSTPPGVIHHKSFCKFQPEFTKQVTDFVTQQILRRRKNSTIVMRPEILPPESMPKNSEQLLVGAMTMLTCGASQFGRGLPMQGLAFLLKAAIDLSASMVKMGAALPETTTIGLLQVAAQGLVTAGNTQDAKDLAEAALYYAGSEESNAQKRCAWMTYADISLRRHMITEALVGLICAGLQEVSALTMEDAYLEASLRVRLNRDLGLLERALEGIPALRELVSSADNQMSHERIIQDLENGIRLAIISREGNGTTWTDEENKEIQRLVQETTNSVRTTLEQEFDVPAAAVLLGQLLERMKDRGLPIPVESSKAYSDALAFVSEDVRDRILLGVGQEFETSRLLELAQSMAPTKQTAELSSDIKVLHSAAKRALSQSTQPGDTLLLMELLSDPSADLAASSWMNDDEKQRRKTLNALARGYHQRIYSKETWDVDHSQAPAAVVEHLRERPAYPFAAFVSQPDQILSLACSVGHATTEFWALSLDDQESLVKVRAAAGGLSRPAIGASVVFDADLWKNWCKKYPRAFADMDSSDPAGLSDVEQVMNGIGVSEPPESGRSLVLMLSCDLTGLPANLLLSSEGLMGVNHPVTTIPSLSWLQTARQHPKRASGTSRRAWILRSEPSAGFMVSPLKILEDNLPELLHPHGFDVRAIDGLPTPDTDVEVSVFAAHGEIDPAWNSFRALSDESDRFYSPAEVASTLAGSSLVILFVCSGGRLARELMQSRVTGLPRELLDKGCRAVVASPWPIDALVAMRWVGKFLKIWDAGLKVSEAVWSANAVIRERFCHPKDFLAMHVFGDPDLHSGATK